MKRRTFLKTINLTLATPFLVDFRLLKSKNKALKPIEGSWFEFQHHNKAEGKYWNTTLKNFTAKQWEYKIKEMAESGLKYLVLLDVAIDNKTFYPSKLLPQHDLGCEDPLEVVLNAADKYEIHFFVSNGFWGDWTRPVHLMKDPQIYSLRMKAMEEIASKYAHHKSFYGWYYPCETGINKYFEDFFIDYVNTSSAQAAKLTPKAKTLIAPYGTRNVKTDDTYIRQLEKLNVDFIAYQDEVGVEKTKVEESSIYFENLYKAHKKAARSRLWADVEIFKFEGEVYKSALLPAPFERVIKQIEAVSSFVEKILIYQYIGLLNKPKTMAFAGHKDSVFLYNQLAKKGILSYK